MSAIQLLRNDQDLIRVPKGQVIFQGGDPGDTMYVVLDGEINILFHNKVIETIGVGGIFGEMALIDAQPRSATAIANTDAQIARVTEERFQFLVQYSPFFALEVMRVMAKRLRARME